MRFHDRAKSPMGDSPALTLLFEHHRDELVVSPSAAAKSQTC